MNKIIEHFKKLKKEERIIFFLVFTTIGNIFMAIVKFILSLTLPSLWFFINAIFMIVLSFARFFSIRDYSKTKRAEEIIERAMNLAREQIPKGKVATYIPELGKMDPHQLGICLYRITDCLGIRSVNFIDDNNNVVCAVYEFTLTNNGTNPVEITAKIIPKAIPTGDDGKPEYVGFQNLKYTLYDISEAEELTNGFSQEEGEATAIEVSGGVIDGAMTYTDFNILPTATEIAAGKDNAKRYRLFIWLDEKGEANDDEQGAKFSGQVIIDVAGETNETITGTADEGTAD